MDTTLSSLQVSQAGLAAKANVLIDEVAGEGRGSSNIPDALGRL